MKLSIVILDYMKAKRVTENVASIMAQNLPFDFHVVVVDNSENVENAEMLKTLESDKVSVVINGKNLGYPKAHNAINPQLLGDYVLIVNPDILWKESGAIAKMVSYMDGHPDIGLLGPRQINDNGETAMTVRAFPKLYLQVSRRTFLRKLPFLREKVAYDEMQHLDYSMIQDVDWIQSSCVIIRKKLWDDLGGFSDDYFIFMADVEICLEAWKRGYKVVYYPEAMVWADGKRASAGGFKKFFQSWVLRQHLVDSVKYRLKHFLEKNPRLEYYKRHG